MPAGAFTVLMGEGLPATSIAPLSPAAADAGMRGGAVLYPSSCIIVRWQCLAILVMIMALYVKDCTHTEHCAHLSNGQHIPRSS